MVPLFFGMMCATLLPFAANCQLLPHSISGRCDLRKPPSPIGDKYEGAMEVCLPTDASKIEGTMPHDSTAGLGTRNDDVAGGWG